MVIKIHVELALQPLLHDFHVQQAEEAAAEAEAQRLRHFRLVVQRGIVQLELFQRVAQRFILVRFHRKQSGEHLRLHFLEAGQRLLRRLAQMGDRIAHLGRFQFLDTGNNESDLACAQAFARLRLGREYADIFGQMLRACGHEQNFFLGLERAVHHPHQHHHADVIVEPRIDNQRLQRRVRIALWGRAL